MLELFYIISDFYYFQIDPNKNINTNVLENIVPFSKNYLKIWVQSLMLILGFSVPILKVNPSS
jgi:hypothetical protein